MNKRNIIGAMLVSSAILFAGCSGSIQIGPVPTVTPRAEEDRRPTAAPTPTGAAEDNKNDNNATNVVDKKDYKAQYEEKGTIPSIKELYKDVFTIGLNALTSDVTDADRAKLVTSQFAALSSKKGFDPSVLLDYEATRESKDLTHAVLDFTEADTILDFAAKNDLTVRGPILISQSMPAWFFTANFNESQVKTTTTVENGTETTTETITPASKDVMKQRMENYIKDIMEHCNQNYPGVVISWDVVNDAINVEDKLDKRLRNSYWYQTIGEEYITEAFRLASGLRTDGQKLLYREDGLDNSLTRPFIVSLVQELKDKGFVDGYAVNMTFTLEAPNTFAVDDVFKAITELGLEIQLPDFYISSITNSQGDKTRTVEENLEKCSKRYKAVLTSMQKAVKDGKYNITYVSIGGLTDDTNDNNTPKEYVDSDTGETVFGVELYDYAYLFDENMLPKDAFFGAVQDVSIKSY